MGQQGIVDTYIAVSPLLMHMVHHIAADYNTQILTESYQEYQDEWESIKPTLRPL